MADCTRPSTRLIVTDGFNAADGYPDPSPADYNDLTMTPPTNWGYIGARTPRRYGVGKLGWWPVENGGLMMFEATSDDIANAIPLMNRQNFHDLNASYKGAIPLSNTDSEYATIGSEPPNYTDPMMAVQGQMVAAQSPHYGGVGIWVYGKVGGTYQLRGIFSVRYYNTVTNNFRLYRDTVIIGQTTVDYADRNDGPIRLEMFHTNNEPTQEPSEGLFTFRVFHGTDLVTTPKLTVSGINGYTSTEHAFYYGLMVARGNTYLENFSVQYPGGTGGSVDGWSDPSTVTPLSLPSPTPSLFFFHRDRPCTLDTIYQTDVARARTLDEDRRLLAARPNRSLLVNHRALQRDDMWMLYMNLIRHGKERVPVPLFCDHSKVTGASSGTNIACDTKYRRFFNGQRIIIHTWEMRNGASMPTGFEYDTIASFTDSAITTVDGLSGTFGAGDRVYPCLDAEIMLRGDMEAMTDQTVDLIVDAEEVYGKSALLPTASDTPSGFSEYLDYPVLNIAPSWRDVIPGMQVEGRSRILGRGRFVETYGDRPRYTIRIGYDQLSRSAIWPLIQLFDSRRGRLRNFFFVDRLAPFRVEETNVDYFDIYAVGNFDDLDDWLTYVAVVERDGTTTLRTVTVTDNGATWRVNFSVALSSAPAIADVRRFCPVYLVRFSSDRLTESWTTDEHCSLSFQMIEQLLDQDVTVSCLF